MITRARAQGPAFRALLEAQGAAVIEFPTIRFEAPEDPAALRRAVRDASRYDWLVFTSANGVAAFWRELVGQGLGARALAGVRVCAIGPATAQALEEVGIKPEVVPDRYMAEGVVETLAAADRLEGRRILIPRAAVARRELPDGLRAQGAVVDEVAAYRTVPDGEGADVLRERLRAGEVDLIAFTASSTVRSYHALLGAMTGGAAVAAIGPVTAETARELGFRVDVVAREYTIPGLAKAIADFLTREA